MSLSSNFCPRKSGQPSPYLQQQQQQPRRVGLSLKQKPPRLLRSLPGFSKPHPQNSTMDGYGGDVDENAEPMSDSSDIDMGNIRTSNITPTTFTFTKQKAPEATRRRVKKEQEKSSEPEAKSMSAKEKRATGGRRQVKREPPAEKGTGDSPRSESSTSQKRKAQESEEQMGRNFKDNDDILTASKKPSGKATYGRNRSTTKKPKTSQDEPASSPDRKPLLQYTGSTSLTKMSQDEPTPSPKKTALKTLKSTVAEPSSSPPRRGFISSSKAAETCAPEPTPSPHKSFVKPPDITSHQKEPGKKPGDATRRFREKLHARKLKKPNPAGDKSPEATQRPMFKMYELGPEEDESPLSSFRESLSPPRSPVQTSSQNTCPMCGEEVSRALLDNFKRKHPRMTLQLEQKFCDHHNKTSAKEAWLLKGYPDINWGMLEKRIEKQHGYIRGILKGNKCHYGDIFSEKVKSGQNKTLLKSEENPTPGYYGTRGLRLMSEHMVKAFSSLLRDRAVKDRLVSARGHTAYVQAVLVPELAVQLIMEDMSVDAEEARSIMNESVWVGEQLNEEVADVVMSDSDDDDKLSSLSEPESP